MIGIVTTASTGVSHGLGVTNQKLGKAEDRQSVKTVCGKTVYGTLSSVENVTDIRCRPCKGLIAKGRLYQKGVRNG